MAIQQIKRWQWILIALVLGLTIGAVRNYLEGQAEDFGESFNKVEDFEDALTTAIPLTTGPRPMFDNLTVYLREDPTASSARAVTSMSREGSTATVACPDHGWTNGDVVTIAGANQGEYNGKFTIANATVNSFTVTVPGKPPAKGTGSITATGRPKMCHIVAGMKYAALKHAYLPYFLKASIPFELAVGLKSPPGMVKPKVSALQRLLEFVHLRQPDPPNTVIDYLQFMNAQYGTKFTYKWASQPRTQIAVWTGGCFVIIGLVWPTLVNIMVFGSVFRPKEVKADLGKRRAPPTPQPRATVSAKDMEELKLMEAEMEAKLAAAGVRMTGGASATGTATAAAPVRKLDASGEPTKAIEQPKEERAFGGTEQDFYPTERHVPKK